MSSFDQRPDSSGRSTTEIHRRPQPIRHGGTDAAVVLSSSTCIDPDRAGGAGVQHAQRADGGKNRAAGHRRCPRARWCQPPRRCPSRPHPRPSRRLAAAARWRFTLRRNGNSDIYAVNAGDKQLIRLVSHPADDRDAAFSPDGNEMAFASHRDGNWDIYRMDVVSGVTTRLTFSTTYDGAPAWSPDGKQIVFEVVSRRQSRSVRDGSRRPERQTPDHRSCAGHQSRLVARRQIDRVCVVSQWQQRHLSCCRSMRPIAKAIWRI